MLVVVTFHFSKLIHPMNDKSVLDASLWVSFLTYTLLFDEGSVKKVVDFLLPNLDGSINHSLA